MTPAQSAAAALEFRSKLRDEMIARRAVISTPEMAGLCRPLAAHLTTLIAQLAPRTLGFCWPWRGEFDARDIIAAWLQEDPRRKAALPVIETPAAPMKFRAWTPQAAMLRGRFGIAVPAQGEWLHPEVFLMPVVAFDAAGFRLGYGGGYFDRTLAAMAPRAIAVGVGFACQQTDSILPQPWDQPLDWMVTELGARRLVVPGHDPAK